MLSGILQHHEDVIAQRTGDNIVLFHMNSGSYYSLNELGARIWELCDGRRSFNDVVDEVEAEYDAPREQIEQDSHDLTSKLINNGLLIIRSVDDVASE